MRSLFSNDTVLGQRICFVVDLIALNVLWFICSIPIITIGPSTTALYYALSARKNGEEQMIRTFLYGFKKNFTKAFPVWMLSLAIGFMLWWSFYIIDQWGDARNTGLIILCIPIMLYIIIVSYIFPLLAEFETTVPQLLSNSVLLSIAHFPSSIAIGFINIIPILILFIFPSWFSTIIFIWLPICFSLCAYFNHKLMIPIFSPYKSDIVD